VGEQKLLRRDGTRRKHIKGDAVRVPAAQGRGGVRVKMGLQFAGFVSAAPDEALESLQRLDLAVRVAPSQQERHDLVEPEGGVPLHRPDFGKRRGHFGHGGAVPEELPHALTRIREQHRMDEGDVGGGAFDIGKDGRARQDAIRRISGIGPRSDRR
jgi:hypothetical protein